MTAGERLAGSQRLRPDEVETEIAVAEPEPVLAAERRDRLEGAPALVRAAPTSLLVVQAGQRVEDAVEIRRDGHPEHLEVVADVADHGHVRGVDRRRQAAREPGAADAPGQERDPHSSLSAPSAACVRGPTLSASRSRSARVSTSSTRFGIAAVDVS